jgi:hypothetical protein
MDENGSVNVAQVLIAQKSAHQTGCAVEWNAVRQIEDEPACSCSHGNDRHVKFCGGFQQAPQTIYLSVGQ